MCKHDGVAQVSLLRPGIHHSEMYVFFEDRKLQGTTLGLAEGNEEGIHLLGDTSRGQKSQVAEGHIHKALPR
jgi:hypothetical protein